VIVPGLQGATVLVTGGTRGFGKAVGIEFARAGASVYLTHRWGSTDEDELAAVFRAGGLPAPRIIESDVGDPEATRELMAILKAEAGALDVVISNVAFAKVVRDLEDMRRSTFELSLKYSAWPVVDLVQAAHETFNRYPSYVVGVSSGGGEICYDGYDLAGPAKAVLETLCRYLAYRLKPHGVRVNAIRPGLLDTDSSRATLGDEAVDTVKNQLGDFLLDPHNVARVCVALCSGLMDSVTGQVIAVDEGWSLVSPMAYLTGSGLLGAFPANDEGARRDEGAR
jgi:NAD(P)-dependent dehydrogenase (short-subunit alcohol dehydrogenase family)